MNSVIPKNRETIHFKSVGEHLLELVKRGNPDETEAYIQHMNFPSPLVRKSDAWRKKEFSEINAISYAVENNNIEVLKVLVRLFPEFVDVPSIRSHNHETKNPAQLSPLAIAAQKNRVEIANLLLESGANPFKRPHIEHEDIAIDNSFSFSRSPLYFSILLNRSKILGLIAEKISPDTKIDAESVPFLARALAFADNPNSKLHQTWTGMFPHGVNVGEILMKEAFLHGSVKTIARLTDRGFKLRQEHFKSFVFPERNKEDEVSYLEGQQLFYYSPGQIIELSEKKDEPIFAISKILLKSGFSFQKDDFYKSLLAGKPHRAISMVLSGLPVDQDMCHEFSSSFGEDTGSALFSIFLKRTQNTLKHQNRSTM